MSREEQAISDTNIAAWSIGRRQSVCFKVAQIDAVTADVDLLVIGMFAEDGVNLPGGGASQLDLALHGTLGRLRKGGIFTGAPGETLTLSTPPSPIGARSLMLVGMGDRLAAGCIGEPTELAMRTALRLRVRSVGCLLAWLGRPIPPELVEASAAAMMQGAIRAIDDCADPINLPTLEWIFDIRNGDAMRMATALRCALDAAT